MGSGSTEVSSRCEKPSTNHSDPLLRYSAAKCTMFSLSDASTSIYDMTGPEGQQNMSQSWGFVSFLFSVSVQTAQIKARHLLRADEFVSFSQKLHGWLSISAGSLTRKYTRRFKCCGKCHCQRADMEKERKEKKPKNLKCTETTCFFFSFLDFPTVTRPVFWGKCFKKSIIFTRNVVFTPKLYLQLLCGNEMEH